MEPIAVEAENLTSGTVASHPVCTAWAEGPETSVFHLANMLLVLGFMGGSGFYGLLYLYSFLAVGFFCSSIWAWSDPCTTDTFLWSFVLFAACVGQVVHVAYRLRNVTFEKEFQDLYNYMFKKLGVSLVHFGKIVVCCEGDIHTIEKDHCFAVEGKTSIDKLSVLVSGRIRVTEGIFQVTLRADNQCRYIAWRRKKLYLLFARHRYIAKIFALVVRNDIADKLYSLNDKAFDSGGIRFDLRLPSYCHVPGPELERTAAFLQVAEKE
ncbi:popeye domain-containing protein 3 isoform X1 [Hypomesus transpacificus]|uniref:popeye domain-containing protein 3 isoform X1 n=1 Tax=Hypomesus transpacificus TaxID=137520 RepID=UPI001F0815DA|nr:popeye domain-containing protein 3 isoform X1 [Hypomesus transpacificus]